MNKKIFIFIFLFLFLVIIFNSTLITAPGIAGAVYEVLFFEPGLEKTYVYHVDSNTIRPMDHYIDMNGDLTPYFTLSTSVFEDLAPGELRSFEAHMKLPQELEPGEHRLYICATEAEGRTPEGAGAGIGTRVRVCAVIIVISPHLGKHVEVSMDVENVAKGEDAEFKLNVFNIGTEAIDIHSVIDIYSQEVSAGKETKIVTLKTDKDYLVSGQKTTLSASHNTSDMDIGEYKVKAILYYDGLQETVEKTFRVGELNIEILEFTEEVSQNQLNPINVKVKNGWKGEIKDIYASIEVKHPTKNLVIATIKTPPTNIKAWETRNLVAYWDTTGIETGEYDAKVVLHYEDKTTVKEGKIKVKEFVEGPAISLTAILLFMLIIAVLVLIILIIHMMKKRQGRVVKKKKIKK
ncbi:MAG: hypothetical protein IB618_00025 [Candidatus Pacearchaeota archaeon]|nr:MAG: hypothetical protein IB618_00025 [Candidatus Pacearchaeota archaeon]